MRTICNRGSISDSRTRVKSFDGLGTYVEACYKNGVISNNGVQAFVDGENALDEAIKRIFAETDRMDMITESHRRSYRTWLSWGYGYDAIVAVAKSCAETAFPFSAINRVLAELRRQNVLDIDGVNKYLSERGPSALTTSNKGGQDDYLKHAYTKEQLDGVVRRLEDMDDDWGD